MKKVVTYTRDILSCDFCDKNMYKTCIEHCSICGKDICSDHTTFVEVTKLDFVDLCPDCVKKDLTEYKNACIEVQQKYDEYCAADKKRKELLRSYKNGNISRGDKESTN